MAKRVERENVETGENETHWSRQTPVGHINGSEYMLARIENEGEKSTHLIVVRDTSANQYSILMRADGTPVQIAKPSQFQLFLDALQMRF